MLRESDILEQYYEWLCDLVTEDDTQYGYQSLLRYLFERDFVALLDMDVNRAGDGINLRYRFGDEVGYSNAAIANFLDTTDCSVLEVMIALALRCEEHIMANSEKGDRTARWFWDMIDNLGLTKMTDRRFDICGTEEIVTRFIERQYEPNGKGGLVTTNDRSVDMRTVDIWYQMMWHLSDLIEN